MQTVLLSKGTANFNKQAAYILKQAFPHCYADCSNDEINICVQGDRVAIAMVDGETLLGFVGAIPQYGMTVWEQHPSVVRENFRSQGIGAQLCIALENILKENYSVEKDENGNPLIVFDSPEKPSQESPDTVKSPNPAKPPSEDEKQEIMKAKDSSEDEQLGIESRFQTIDQ